MDGYQPVGYCMRCSQVFHVPFAEHEKSCPRPERCGAVTPAPLSDGTDRRCIRAVGHGYAHEILIKDGLSHRWIDSEVSLDSGPPSESKSILDEARDLVHGERQKHYGHPRENFRYIGEAWGAILHTPPVPPRVVGLMLIAMKVVRDANAPRRDNLRDAAGYAEATSMIDDTYNKD